MNKTTSAETQTAGRHLESVTTDQVEDQMARRAALRSRHAQGLTKLMEQRNDLRGVNDLADFVDDAIRWTA